MLTLMDSVDQLDIYRQDHSKTIIKKASLVIY